MGGERGAGEEGVGEGREVVGVGAGEEGKGESEVVESRKRGVGRVGREEGGTEEVGVGEGEGEGMEGKDGEEKEGGEG